ncbi:NAD(P)-binding protein [Cucurbitaria berberidis CBS 394.84]|uniref:NAD(P)-binding protein n=1 Tax=Cucurbitaria berberidis CBS 394.84 TaxID=1168544 RepID=A0A9P4GPB4_9PLEO|nr:NAD(P)-binding protein [Cucurbitaria berberidis CBS 394.84]KAF1849240.1 NAD(P)-binding protein [Cucurbitaria berberidis CBS 394.84]
MTTTLTHPEWDKETGGLEVAKTFAERIRGKNVLITGVSPESIGSSIALSIASQSPALLILASRTQHKLDEVVKSIKDAYPDTHVKTVLLDLMSQDSVKAAAAEVAQLTNRLDLVINNAGFMSQKRQWTREGIEGQFGANHIGHFLFTNLLIPQLLTSASSNATGATRVINLTSLGHRLSPIRFSDYNLEKLGDEVPPEEMHAPLPPMFQQSTDDGYIGFVAYGQAKTANILFSVALNERLSGKGVASYAVHPGSIWTGLSRDLDPDGEAAIRKTSPFWKNHDQGAATVLVAALDPALDEPKGVLLHDCQIFGAAPHATDPKVAERLWALSEKLVQQKFKL